MNILQIHIGKLPSKKRIECMKSVLKNLRKKDTYFLISTKNFLKDDRVKLIDYKTYIKTMTKDKVIKAFWNSIPKSVDNHCSRADVLRFHYLANNNDTLYIDTDVMLNKIPKLDKDSTYFTKYYNSFDFYMMYGDKEIFKEIFNLTINTKFNKNLFYANVNHKKFINSYESIDTNSHQHLDI